MSMDEHYAHNTIAILMGGRIAEELVFEQMTTGAGNDIERATDIAHKMVCEWGMSRELGPVAFGKREEQIFLGRELTRTRNYSERTAERIDGEVRAIIDNNYNRARDILTRRRDGLDALAEALLERETLEGTEIDAVLAGDELPPVVGDGADDASAKEERPRAESDEEKAPLFGGSKVTDPAG